MTITMREAARRLKTEPAALRRFIRRHGAVEQVGRGGRYSISGRDFRTLKARFDKWKKDRA